MATTSIAQSAATAARDRSDAELRERQWGQQHAIELSTIASHMRTHMDRSLMCSAGPAPTIGDINACATMGPMGDLPRGAALSYMDSTFAQRKAEADAAKNRKTRCSLSQQFTPGFTN